MGGEGGWEGREDGRGGEGRGEEERGGGGERGGEGGRGDPPYSAHTPSSHQSKLYRGIGFAVTIRPVPDFYFPRLFIRQAKYGQGRGYNVTAAGQRSNQYLEKFCLVLPRCTISWNLWGTWLRDTCKHSFHTLAHKGCSLGVGAVSLQ